MTEHIETVFLALKKRAAESEKYAERIEDKEVRKLESVPNESESSEWLKKGTIKSYYFFVEKSKGFGILQKDSEYLLFTLGFDLMQKLPDYLEEMEANSGVWVLLVSELA
ncbi:MAG: hypothetical protein ACKVTZ_21920, partial [Bacteroidia bacterium]